MIRGSKRREGPVTFLSQFRTLKGGFEATGVVPLPQAQVQAPLLQMVSQRLRLPGIARRRRFLGPYPLMQWPHAQLREELQKR
jgi:hypothetical protein